ncbi:hypothetical protein Dfri01_59360 [Dyadobacter frigoris]|uniref:hypothetical protein n=1 Tax=Dyadobacter frigoris TaxID=2576211 RepID=UPI0024A50BEA|nr:hypothetical protein [Dyadobacter frigoris]GLU56475.1 hypothetical protein Dfri01_59360 [Dyadobacter frigoris]
MKLSISTAFDLFFGCLGNGTTVSNRKELVNGDYKNIAHISDSGIITYYVKNLPAAVVADIELHAKNQASLYQLELLKRKENERLHKEWISKTSKIK